MSCRQGGGQDIGSNKPGPAGQEEPHLKSIENAAFTSSKALMRPTVSGGLFKVSDETPVGLAEELKLNHMRLSTPSGFGSGSCIIGFRRDADTMWV